MIRTKVGAVVLAGAALTLSACGAGSSNQPQQTPPVDSPFIPVDTSPAPQPSNGQPVPGQPVPGQPQSQDSKEPGATTKAGSRPGRVPDATAVARCASVELSLELKAVNQDGSGQYRIPLAYKNNSNRACDLHGVPGVDLTGPDNPTYGPVYSMPRVDNGPGTNVLQPGQEAVAILTLLADDEPGAWHPTEIVTIPPGQEVPLRQSWPYDFGVLRQDGATHPGSYVHGIGAN